jgi:5-(carboxyamino)imidazole ribonucleotide synthase
MRVGVIGGGQLARMMIPPALEWGIELRVLAEEAGSSASLAVRHVGDYRDITTVLQFAEGLDVVTFDHEHVPGEVLEALGKQGIPVRPGPHALRAAQDKSVMRELLSGISVPMPQWMVATHRQDVDSFLATVGGKSLVAKTPRGGYDGKGVRVCDHPDDVADWLSRGSVLLEEKVPFVSELAQLVARRPSGDIVAWPAVSTVQVGGVCSEVIAPAIVSADTTARAQEVAISIADHLEVTGVLAVEMFVLDTGEILVNELAMRPHNSGHIFTELSRTSQFEQHLRAILDLPLGSPELTAECGVMVNIFGGLHHEKVSAALDLDAGLKVHDYGKAARAGRKAGHVSALGSDLEQVRSVARKAVSLIAHDGLA